MGFRDQYETDSKLEADGIVLRYGDGMEIVCARAGGANKHYQRTMEKLSEPYRRAIESKALPNEMAQDLLINVFARSVVRSWTGVTVHDVEANGDHSPLPFSVENCVKFFKALPEVFADVRESVSNARLFRAHIEEIDAKNSPRS